MMRQGVLILLVTAVCGCQVETPEIRTVPVVKRVVAKRRVVESRGTFVVDIITIPRSAFYKVEQLKSTMETAGVYGPDEKLLAMNGLTIGRTDMRFVKQFDKAVASIRSDPRKVATIYLMAGGREQTFDVGDTLREATVSVWTEPGTVKKLTMRHFRRARYRMRLKLEKVQDKVAELKVSWQVQTGAGLGRPVSLGALDVHAELAMGQSLVIAPADFRGRGVGRAFLSGVDEKAVRLTFFVIRPKELIEQGEMR